MTCITPDFSPANLTILPFFINKGMIGFTLDGVTDFQSLTEADDIRDKFEVHHDPIYHMFEGEGHVVEFEYGQRKYLEIAVGLLAYCVVLL